MSDEYLDLLFVTLNLAVMMYTAFFNHLYDS